MSPRSVERLGDTVVESNFTVLNSIQQQVDSLVIGIEVGKNLIGGMKPVRILTFTGRTTTIRQGFSESGST